MWQPWSEGKGRGPTLSISLVIIVISPGEQQDQKTDAVVEEENKVEDEKSVGICFLLLRDLIVEWLTDTYGSIEHQTVFYSPE